MIKKPTQEEVEKREVRNKYFNPVNYSLMMLNEHALQNKYKQKEEVNMSDEIRWVTEFEVKQEHLMLLKNCYVEWYGGINIDSKRPFGNSDIIRDIGEILGEEPDGFDDDDDFSTEQSERFMRLYKELSVVLQIILVTQSFKVGRYTRSDAYHDDWALADA